jgi:hypothetical protein
MEQLEQLASMEVQVQLVQLEQLVLTEQLALLVLMVQLALLVLMVQLEQLALQVQLVLMVPLAPQVQQVHKAAVVACSVTDLMPTHRMVNLHQATCVGTMPHKSIPRRSTSFILIK